MISMNSGFIVDLRRYPQKGAKPDIVNELLLDVEKGIIGDWHGAKDERQVSITSRDLKLWMIEQEEKGFCFNKFKENITLKGISLETLREGDILEIEGVKLQITAYRKKCHSELCKLSKDFKCKLIDSEVFSKVLTNGTIAIGQKVKLKQSL